MVLSIRVFDGLLKDENQVRPLMFTLQDPDKLCDAQNHIHACPELFFTSHQIVRDVISYSSLLRLFSLGQVIH